VLDYCCAFVAIADILKRIFLWFPTKRKKDRKDDEVRFDRLTAGEFGL
jgi:hypothetical protein